jgi:hypothetical protein
MNYELNSTHFISTNYALNLSLPNSSHAASNVTAATAPLLPPAAGFACLVGSSFLWACIYLPVRQFDVGDGFFFQFIVFLGSWSASFIVNCIRGFPPFKVTRTFFS